MASPPYFSRQQRRFLALHVASNVRRMLRGRFRTKSTLGVHQQRTCVVGGSARSSLYNCGHGACRLEPPRTPFIGRPHLKGSLPRPPQVVALVEATAVLKEVSDPSSVQALNDAAQRLVGFSAFLADWREYRDAPQGNFPEWCYQRNRTHRWWFIVYYKHSPKSIVIGVADPVP